MGRGWEGRYFGGDGEGRGERDEKRWGGDILRGEREREWGGEILMEEGRGDGQRGEKLGEEILLGDGEWG